MGNQRANKTALNNDNKPIRQIIVTINFSIVKNQNSSYLFNLKALKLNSK